MTFQEVLYNQLLALPTWTMRQARLARTIEHSAGTPPIVTVLEQIVRAKLNIQPTVLVDWSLQSQSIDWQTIIAFIEKLLTILLSILTAL